MKILYAVQGTGNGHITRAMAVIPELKKHATVDVLISGFSYDLSLPFKVKYQFKGMSFCFGKKGGIDYMETYKKNKLKRFMNEVKQLDLKEYDFVVSDFEPISCWAALKQKKRCIGFSNQSSIFTPNVPLPKSLDFTGKLILKYYAPCSLNFGIHFQQYNPQIFTPIISEEVRKLKTKNEGFYLIYLPAYGIEKIIRVFKQFEKERFVVFSNVKEKIKKKNVSIHPLNRSLFLDRLASCNGVITAAGFSTTADALFLNKKLLVIPQKNQFEQKCNALALKKMGVPTLKKLKKKYIPELLEWMDSSETVNVNYPDNSAFIVQKIIHAGMAVPEKKMKFLPVSDFNLQLVEHKG
jgi:uncharacterized protein (TIGR00661 family)